MGNVLTFINIVIYKSNIQTDYNIFKWSQSYSPLT